MNHKQTQQIYLAYFGKTSFFITNIKHLYTEFFGNILDAIILVEKKGEKQSFLSLSLSLLSNNSYVFS